MTNSLNNRTKTNDGSSGSTPSGFQQDNPSDDSNNPAPSVDSYSIGLDRLKAF
jgi:hypothetical protein